jgi:hypothetical protein
LRRDRAAVHPERALHLLVSEMPEMTSMSGIRHAPRKRSIQYAVLDRENDRRL